MIEKVFLNQTITIGLAGNIDVTGAVNEIRYINPRGERGVFDTPVEVHGKSRIRTKTKLTIPGKWTVWAHTTFSNGDSFPSTSYSFTVFEEGK